jgi:hypothetical protein
MSIRGRSPGRLLGRCQGTISRGGSTHSRPDRSPTRSRVICRGPTISSILAGSIMGRGGASLGSGPGNIENLHTLVKLHGKRGKATQK